MKDLLAFALLVFLCSGLAVLVLNVKPVHAIDGNATNANTDALSTATEELGVIPEIMTIIFIFVSFGVGAYGYLAKYFR